ncbi:MAG: hypothetical protein CL873_04255 [Dehalococcoidales bacterium]|jgi:hypothetical protein|nr:hypothetical protein [Dehalococcoidales bacterium]
MAVNCGITSDMQSDNVRIRRRQRALSKDYNLRTENPEVAKQWNFDKNDPLKPEDFTPGSQEKVWWKCERGHEWEARIGSRTRGSGCPGCYNRYGREQGRV